MTAKRLALLSLATSVRRLILLPLLGALLSCGADGGSSGTGIAAVEGNVASVTTASDTTGIRTAVEGIDVVVEGTSAESETDSEGRFVVRGRFEGPATLLFRRSEDALVARTPISVPAGGTLTLTDVRIDAVRAEATAEDRSVVCDAVIAAIDCGAQVISLANVGSSDAAYTYTLHLEGSTLHDRRDEPISCSGLREGDRVHVEGAVEADGSFGDADVEVDT